MFYAAKFRIWSYNRNCKLMPWFDSGGLGYELRRINLPLILDLKLCIFVLLPFFLIDPVNVEYRMIKTCWKNPLKAARKISVQANINSASLLHICFCCQKLLIGLKEVEKMFREWTKDYKEGGIYRWYVQ